MEELQPPPAIQIGITIGPVGYNCSQGSPVVITSNSTNLENKMRVRVNNTTSSAGYSDFNWEEIIIYNNTRLVPNQNCLVIDVPQSHPFRVTGYFQEKQIENVCIFHPSNPALCAKWFRQEDFPAVSSSVSCSDYPIPYYISKVDPAGMFTTCF